MKGAAEASAGSQTGFGPRKILLADPLHHVHSLLHYRAALASAGYEDAEVTVFTTYLDERERERIEAFARTQPRLRLVSGGFHPPIGSRWQCWRHYGHALREVERLLSRESYDAVIYLMADFVLPFLALPGARQRFPRHAALGLRGLVFGHMGLRAAAGPWRSRLIAAVDRLILRRTLASGVIGRLAFLDTHCADRANATFHTDLCARGIDPVEIPAADREAARRKFGFQPEDFACVLFGAIDRRKGVLETLTALRDSSFADSRLVLLIAGRVDQELKAPMAELVQSCASRVRILLHDQFIADEDLPSYFTAADCVMCPYRNFTASSGVLLHGAGCGNLALVSPGGAMEDAVREFAFGEIASVDQPDEFIASLTRLMNLDAATRAKMSAGALAYAHSREQRHYLGQFFPLPHREPLPSLLR